ncbi:hypothetical protein GMLC_09180 [Geomonas limicola]|uniref:Uncharacterized protein n=1 Tax=Geomonas limicola TaxID=2740186 RepID=A0A6V8N7R1_9BACT|nr:hypothetical protein [Geomonas limicola]GFO67339.1 hypothetical protein GMLC_09180 [Geomonas limicola]
MSELACNIVLYRPDAEKLARTFPTWQVEALLEQADQLIERGLADLARFSRLDYAWHELESDLEVQEKKLGMYQRSAAEEVLEREPVEPREAAHAEAASGDAEEPEAAPPAEGGEVAAHFEEPAAEQAPQSSLDVRVEAVQRKKKLAEPGGPFALNEQRDLVLRRLCHDYEAAVDRCVVAELGLKLFYGHEPKSRPLPTEAESLGTSMTSLALWIREARHVLAMCRLREESFVRVVSVRSLLNRNAWALLRHARDSYAIKLQVPVDLFREHDNCRISGISAYLVGEAGTVPWSLTVRVPEEAVYERGGHSIEADQSGRPACLVGRLENRRTGRTPDLCGSSLLLGASPIGRSTQGGLWSLEIFKPMGATSETFSHIEDLVLEIHSVGMPH